MSQPGARKTSLGPNSRRGPLKAHIPYRGDDLEHGKKTGKAVNQVSRDADDFEPFEQVLDQAYEGEGVSRPANVKGKAVNGHVSKPSLPRIEHGYDDFGEVSMDMDIDSTNNSPSVYFTTTIAPEPSSTKRVGSTSRPLPRGSSIDYDRIPSPKPARRHSPPSSHRVSQPLFPSRLRQEIRDSPDISRGINAVSARNSFISGDMDYVPDNESYGGDKEQVSPNPRSNLSFTALAQEDDDDPMPETEETDETPISSRLVRGNNRARDSGGEQEDYEVEEDIATGLHELQEVEEIEEPITRTTPDPPTPQPRIKRPAKKTTSKRTKGKPRISTYETFDQNGLRRGKRQRYPPLEYWRQEKVVYGRRENGRSVVPVIKEIITIPKEIPEPLGAKKRKRGSTRAPRSKSKSLASPSPPVEEVRIVEVDNPELGWDDDTVCNGIIVDWGSKTEVERRVAFTARMINPKPAQANKYSFQKVFGDGDFMAAGQLIIPPGEEKATKPAKDNTYIFYVIEGAVECKVHRSSFVLATGGMFLVPRGNQYYIKNICERDVKIFFAQARKLPENQVEATPEIHSRGSVAT